MIKADLSEFAKSVLKKLEETPITSIDDVRGKLKQVVEFSLAICMLTQEKKQEDDCKFQLLSDMQEAVLRSNAAILTGILNFYNKSGE